jgi:hypothetical protein
MLSNLVELATWIDWQCSPSSALRAALVLSQQSLLGTCTGTGFLVCLGVLSILVTDALGSLIPSSVTKPLCRSAIRLKKVGHGCQQCRVEVGHYVMFNPKNSAVGQVDGMV